MTIISISINENLKKFINKLVTKNKYENRSKLIRDALLRLMSSSELTEYVDSPDTLLRSEKDIITGNMTIILPNDPGLLRKVNKIEVEYQNQIISKSQHFAGEDIMLFVVVEATLQDFQEIVVEINSIKEIKNFRYMILN